MASESNNSTSRWEIDLRIKSDCGPGYRRLAVIDIEFLQIEFLLRTVDLRLDSSVSSQS